ncbi:MAG: MMPL family transporter [Desulfobacteraceae bacterium]|nr:MMPL family transporter [Desulfobacteraceae bacterium]
MGKFVKGLNGFFESLPGKLRKRKWMVLAIFIAITVVLGAEASKIIMDNSLDSFFKKDDPVKKEYDKFRTVFGGDEYIYVVYKAKDGDIFSDNSVKALKGFYDEITNYRLNLKPTDKSPFDHIVEVKSLINLKFLEASKDTLYSRSLIGDNIPENEVEREALRNKALNHPDYPYLYLSKDSKYGGILLRTDFNSEVVYEDSKTEPKNQSGLFDEDEEEFSEGLYYSTTNNLTDHLTFKETEIAEYPYLVSALRKLMQKEEYTDALEFHAVGTPVMMDFFGDAVMKDLGKIMGLVLLIIIVMLWFLFRSFSAVVWPVSIVVITLLWATGIIGWSGIHMSIMFQIIIFMILAVGVADSVHIMSGYLFFRNQGYNHDKALKSVMRKSGVACFLTSTTTAIGLMSLSLVPIKPIAVFGIFSSLGVFAAFIITVFLMPLMLDLWNPIPKKTNKKKLLIQRLIRKTENTGSQKPRTVIIVFTVLGIFFFAGLMNLRIDSNDIEVFKEGLPIKHSYNIVNEHMAGSGNMEISINFKKENALKDPTVLNEMEKLQDYLLSFEWLEVVKTASLVNVVKDSYKALNNSDEKFYAIPQDPEMLSQTLFLFENANNEDRKRLVTDDYSRARIGLNTINAGSIQALAFQENVQTYIDINFSGLKEKYPGCEIILTGNNALIAIMLDYISWSQIKSFGLSLLVISVILFLVFSNFKAGAIAIIPNVFPILTTFGIMGFLDIPLDMDTLLIAPVIIGLAVDDTIHFLTHYKLEMEKYADIKKAVVNSIREAGQAICFTSIILASGFSMFFLSFHNGLSHFGIFSAIAILTAFIADIYLLPALCVFFEVDFNEAPVKSDHAIATNY